MPSSTQEAFPLRGYHVQSIEKWDASNGKLIYIYMYRGREHVTTYHSQDDDNGNDKQMGCEHQDNFHACFYHE